MTTYIVRNTVINYFEQKIEANDPQQAQSLAAEQQFHNELAPKRMKIESDIVPVELAFEGGA